MRILVFSYKLERGVRHGSELSFSWLLRSRNMIRKAVPIIEKDVRSM